MIPCYCHLLFWLICLVALSTYCTINIVNVTFWTNFQDLLNMSLFELHLTSPPNLYSTLSCNSERSLMLSQPAICTTIFRCSMVKIVKTLPLYSDLQAAAGSVHRQWGRADAATGGAGRPAPCPLQTHLPPVLPGSASLSAGLPQEPGSVLSNPYETWGVRAVRVRGKRFIPKYSDSILQ